MRRKEKNPTENQKMVVYFIHEFVARQFSKDGKLECHWDGEYSVTEGLLVYWNMYKLSNRPNSGFQKQTYI